MLWQRRTEPTAQLLERLHSQFPELSHDEVLVAAIGATALPAPEPIAPDLTLAGSATPGEPPRYRA